MRVLQLLPLMCASCSVLVARGPGKADPKEVYANCTESRLAPGIDAAITILSIATIGYVVAEEAECEGEFCGLGYVVVGAPALVTSLVFGISAGWGFGATRRCREAHAAYLEAHPPGKELAPSPPPGGP